MQLAKERKGEIFVFIAVFVGSLFPVITVLSYNTLSPLLSFTGSTFFATLFFGIFLSLKKKWREFQNASALRDTLLTAFLMGVIYILTFLALSYSSAGNVSILALTEVFFSFIFFQLWRKDYLPYQHVLGVIFVIAGAFIVLFPNLGLFTGGEFLILIVAIIAPIANFFQQRARKQISSESIMFIRSLMAAIGGLLIILFTNTPFLSKKITTSLFLVLINGLFLMGLSKIFWIEGIHRISVTKATALNGIAPFLTVFFAWILLQDSPTIWQLSSLIPMFVGVVLLGTKESIQR